jgi:endonuclease/exonuclease/phosphatase family metal-dependent hydrolase
MLPSMRYGAPAVITVALLVGCYGVETTDGEWRPVDEIEGVLAPEISAPPVPLTAPSVLRIATYNIYFPGDAARTAREIAESPEMSRAHIIVAQEVEDRHDEPISRARVIGDALGMSWVFAPARIEEGYRHGVAIFSRFPITNARAMQLPIGTHAYNTNQRNALIADIDVGGRIVSVVDIHLDVYIGAVDRIRQIHPVATQVPDDVVIGGDFNTNPWAWVGSLVPLTSTEAIVGQDQAIVIDDYMSGLGFTIPFGPRETTFNRPPLENIRLDNLYVRGHAIVGKGITSDVEGSDHWPVWIDLQL